MTCAICCSSPVPPPRGTVRVPGDKSIFIARSCSRLLQWAKARYPACSKVRMCSPRLPRCGFSAPVSSAAMMACMADSRRWRGCAFDGAGLKPFDMGNSGTSTRLLMGLLASHALTATFVGGRSALKRPIGRVTTPLGLMGADFTTAPGGRLPLTMRGIVPAVPIEYRLPVASAQVKCCGAARRAKHAWHQRGSSSQCRHAIIASACSSGFGADLRVEYELDGTRIISIRGEAELRPQTLVVPGDPSSAAFPVVAALITPGSDDRDQCRYEPDPYGPLRHARRRMGADLTVINEREVGGEPVADLVARHSQLHGYRCPPDVAPSMIDEFPIFFVAAGCAKARHARRAASTSCASRNPIGLPSWRKDLARIGARVEEQRGRAHHRRHRWRRAARWRQSVAPIIARGTGSPHRDELCRLPAARPRAALLIDDMSPVATSFPGFVEPSFTPSRREAMTTRARSTVDRSGRQRPDGRPPMPIRTWRSTSISSLFNLLNLVGALLLIYSLTVHLNMASMALEIVWAAIALFGVGSGAAGKAR